MKTRFSHLTWVLLFLLMQCTSTENTSTSVDLCGVCSTETVSFLSHISGARVTDVDGNAVSTVASDTISASQSASLEEDGDCQVSSYYATDSAYSTGYLAYKPVATIDFSFVENGIAYDVVINTSEDNTSWDFAVSVNGVSAAVEVEYHNFSSSSEYISLSEDFTSPRFYDLTLFIAYTNDEEVLRIFEMDLQWGYAEIALAYTPEMVCAIDCIETWAPDGESGDINCDYSCDNLEGSFSYRDFFGGIYGSPEVEIFSETAVVEAAGACQYTGISADLSEIPNLDFALSQ